MDDRFMQLVADWKILKAAGNTPTVEDHCKSCPELVESFRRLLSLAHTWAEQRAAGQRLTPEQHCKDDSELLDAFYGLLFEETTIAVQDAINRINKDKSADAREELFAFARGRMEVIVRKALKTFQRSLPQQDVDDIVQEANLRLAKAFATITDKNDSGKVMSLTTAYAFFGFFATTAKNVLKDLVRRRFAKKRPDAHLANAPLGPGGIDVAIEESDAASAAKIEQLYEAIDKLPADLKSVIDLRLIGLSQREIAKNLGISVESVKSRFMRASVALLNILGDDFLDQDVRYLT